MIQLAVPTAYRDIIKNNWSNEFIITKEQRTDPTLAVVRQWLENGARQTDMPTVPDLREYWLQFDTLKLHDDILYRQYFDTKGEVTNLQLLIPPTMRTTILELVHAAVGHAQMPMKNEQMLARYAY
jgi:DNA-binding transcriptional regulator/RsmH inhibitor MraZ